MQLPSRTRMIHHHHYHQTNSNVDLIFIYAVPGGIPLEGIFDGEDAADGFPRPELLPPAVRRQVRRRRRRHEQEMLLLHQLPDQIRGFGVAERRLVLDQPVGSFPREDDFSQLLLRKTQQECACMGE